MRLVLQQAMLAIKTAKAIIFTRIERKESFQASNGKYIAPQQLESLLKQSEYVNQRHRPWLKPQISRGLDRS